MNSFELKTQDWFEGSAPPELAVTNSFLSVVVNDEIVSHLSNQSIRSTSSGVYLPLYPVAEWIAANWWRLLYECNSQRDAENFQACHNLSYAGEGYFLPDLLFSPEMDVIRLQWNTRSINQGQLSFLAHGVANVSFADVRNELARFVQLVIGRLQVNNIADTPLQNDWAAVENSSRDPEERQFCMACAQLGLDPYCISDILADQIIKADELIGNLTDMNEFFNTISPDHIAESVAWLEHAANRMHGRKVFALFREIKERLPVYSDNQPWARGYEEARWVRGNFFRTQSKLRDFQKMIGEAAVQENAPNAFCSALVRTSKEQNPMFVSASFTNSFLQGRMFGEYLRAAAGSINLVTKISTPNQKRCRAFAAELIAPAELLLADVKGRSLLCEDDVSELAEKYQTSEFVIKHQLENHHLAVVV